jgi:hypothetical protein
VKINELEGFVMTHTLKFKPQTLLLWLTLLNVAVLTACTSVQAQDNPAVTATPPVTIEFSGDIQQVTDATIIVSGLTVLITGANIEADLVVGNPIRVAGSLLADGQIQALAIETVADDDDDEQAPEITPEATAAVTPEATPKVTPEATQDADDDDMIIVIEGPVQSININIIVIYGFAIEVDEDDLVLTVLQVGDVIRVEGYYDDDDDNDGRIRLISINITFVSVTVVILDGQVWRDTDTCTAIPDWVPADDIQVVIIRCQGGGNTNNSGNNGGSGVGRGGGGGS